jgi:hypothetical protein
VSGLKLDRLDIFHQPISTYVDIFPQPISTYGRRRPPPDIQTGLMLPAALLLCHLSYLYYLLLELISSTTDVLVCILNFQLFSLSVAQQQQHQQISAGSTTMWWVLWVWLKIVKTAAEWYWGRWWWTSGTGCAGLACRRCQPSNLLPPPPPTNR